MSVPRKSPADPKSYRYLVLQNGLKALLITSCDFEPKSKKAAYTKKSTLSSAIGKAPPPVKCLDTKTKGFDQRNTVKSTEFEIMANHFRGGSSVLQSIVFLSNTPINPLNFEFTDDVPSEELDENIGDFPLPELTMRQKMRVCRETKKYDMLACISLCVGAGFFDDPHDLNGTAHLLEHLCLMGCTKYPESTYFDEFLEFTGGTPWNGNTDGCRTVFYFDTSSDYLCEAFDLLAEHVSSPLLSVKNIAPERENVDGEFRKAVPIHQFRFNQLLQMLSTPGHPYHTFSWGNKESLSRHKSDVQVAEILKSFHKRFYSADNMYLVVQAPETLEELERLVTESFEKIPVKKVQRTPLESFPLPFCNPRFTKLYKVTAISYIRMLMVSWQLPAEAWKEYDVKPLDYLAYVLLNSNRNSLPYYLRKKGFITDLNTNPTESNLERNDAVSIFSLHFTLTKYGLENYQKVLRALFSYIKMMQNEGPQFEIFAELSKIKAMEFHYLREADVGLRIKELSESMRIYKPEDVLSGSILIRKYDRDLIERMTLLLKPEDANYMLFSKEFKSQCASKEIYFGIDYLELEFPPEEMDKLKSVPVYHSFGFCCSNAFITTDFCFAQPDCPADMESVLPMKVNDENHPDDKQPVNLWFYQDSDLVVPQANFTITLSSPVSTDSPKNAAMLDILLVLLRDSVKGQIFFATAAMLEMEIRKTYKGLLFRLAGFSQKLPLLLAEILEEFSNVEENMVYQRSTFKEVFLRVREDMENEMLEPCTLSSDMRQYVFVDNYWSITSRYNVCNEDCISYDDFKSFAKCFRKNLHVRAYTGGNINRTGTKDLMALIRSKVHYEPISEDEYPKTRVNLLPVGEKCLRVQSYSVDGDISIIKNIYQVGLATPENKVICQYILEIISEPMFTVLRAQKQLSYNPEMVSHEDFGVLTLQINLITQADKHELRVVNDEIDAFLEKFYDLEISTLTEGKMNKLRSEYITSLTVHVENPSESEEVWEKIVNENIDFRYVENEIEVWKHLSAKDIKNFFKKYLLRPSYVRKHYPEFVQENKDFYFRKLSIQVVGYDMKERKKLKGTEPNYTHLVHLQYPLAHHSRCSNNNYNYDQDYFINDITTFKQSLFSYPSQF